MSGIFISWVFVSSYFFEGVDFREGLCFFLKAEFLIEIFKVLV